MKAKKGVLCAFLVQERTLHEAELPHQPPTVETTERWYIGTVAAATREGRVREVLTAGGVRYKMDGKLLRVPTVLCIPPDKVNGHDLLVAATSYSWDSVQECEAFTARYVVGAGGPLPASTPA